VPVLAGIGRWMIADSYERDFDLDG
jgi:hypothetical protein